MLNSICLAYAMSADRPDDPSIWMVSLVGFASVFVVLALFWLIIVLLQKVAERGANGLSLPSGSESADVAAGVRTTSDHERGPIADLVPAKGGAGEIDLNDVDDATAALLMAIVADETQIPLNELRFKSIRTLSEKEDGSI